jgi:hypothetical protein
VEIRNSGMKNVCKTKSARCQIAAPVCIVGCIGHTHHVMRYPPWHQRSPALGDMLSSQPHEETPCMRRLTLSPRCCMTNCGTDGTSRRVPLFWHQADSVLYTFFLPE